jgi:hypothetical protein
MDFSLILGLAGIAGQLIMPRRPVLGWSIALANQPLWVIFALLTHHYGLLLMTPGYVLAAAINLRKARHVERSAAAGAAQPSSASARSVIGKP